MDTPSASTATFRLKITTPASLDLGVFTTCEGLGVGAEYKEPQEGGLDAHAWKLPTRVSYSQITLTRPTRGLGEEIHAWLSSYQAGDLGAAKAQIEALGPDGSVLLCWELNAVAPVSWQGPPPASQGAVPDTEVLVLAHDGCPVISGPDQ
ncbi:MULTISPECIES: phage tail protein [Streptomyces]|uniref:phage tail protein n=1 Tax=Streptomyces TaxID=1883 RepID=UPI00345B6272